jgi:hypothetical protein
VLFYSPPRDEDIKISDKKEIIHLAPLHGNCPDLVSRKGGHKVVSSTKLKCVVSIVNVHAVIRSKILN